MSVPIIPAVIAFAVALPVGAFLYRFWVKLGLEMMVDAAREEAARLLSEVKENSEDLMADAKESVAEFTEEYTEKNAREMQDLQKKVEDAEEAYRKKRSQHDREYNQDLKEVQKQSQAVDQKIQKVQARQTKYDELKKKIAEMKAELVHQYIHLSKEDAQVLREQIAKKIEEDAVIAAKRKANEFEAEAKADAEELAKRVIGVALSRFARASSTERGIGIVQLPDEKTKERVMANDGAYVKALGEACGVDVHLGADLFFNIQGFDPVRREIATRALEKLVAERNLNAQSVERVVEKTKTEVFRKIEEDGRKLSIEMGTVDFDPEIKKMLGSLRYRYSFAQNQYFHVAEVGWLCSLMAAELGTVHVPSARRAGVLHDIGKAMDHSMEGGHAVIGADFIKRHGEQEPIVHAVRAHHFEEQPNSDLAFLVIAADAISGARPGARRSTVSSYNQKMEALSTIGDGFKGVNRTLVFNAGREVRILVDSNRVSDEQALVMCREIATKIEEECTYPGQIKVMVVRETHVENVAK